MIYLILLSLLLIIIFLFLNFIILKKVNIKKNKKNKVNKKNKNNNIFLEKFSSSDNNQKPIIWQYWETLPGKNKPGYIDLCLDSVYHNCNKCFNIVVLDNNSIYQYLPELNNNKILKAKLDKLLLPQKVDYYRYCLLEKYGGVWLDADIMVLKCIYPYYQKLEEYDYVGFGCGYDKSVCSKTMNGFGKPLNWFMISRPNTDFIKCVKNKAHEIIKDNNNNLSNNVGYHNLGKVLLDKCYKELNSKNGWTYYHVSSKCQEYNTKGEKLNNIMKKFSWEDCIDERFFFPLYNTAPGYPDWFKNKSKEQLMNEESYLKPIIEIAFSNNNSC
jgi:hypothetical protein